LSDTGLLLSPERFGNLARFVNGINNNSPSSAANVVSLRFMYKGHPRVLLHTLAAGVPAQEELVYDYNKGLGDVGGSSGYPTHQFQ
jgi:hypothetical protein